MHLPALPLPPWFLRAAPLIALAAAVVLRFVIVAILRRRFVPRGAWVSLRIGGAVTELPPPLPPWRRWLPQRTHHPSVAAVWKLTDRIARDSRVAGLVVHLEPLAAGWATAQGLRDAFTRLRAAGKRVVVYLPQGGRSIDLLVASAGDRTYAAPQSVFAPLGVSVEAKFFHGLLERAGVEADALARKEYKSAVEQFTRTGFSEPSRAQTVALMASVHAELVAALAAQRNRPEAEVKAILDAGMLDARDAVERGLLDATVYEDELPTRLGESNATARTVRAERYAAVAMRESFFARFSRAKRVGVVEVKGAIVSEAPSAFGRVADADRVVAALRAARAAPAVGAVVLCVDSPGGSMLASDVIAREVQRLKEKKPVVAYFSDTAASGGYYVAAGANEIVAQPLTVTGSIGVFMLRFVFEKALEKLGIAHEVVRQGERADLLSPYRNWTPSERALLDRHIDRAYEDFVGVVARGRNRAHDVVEPAARGRVYSGRDALEVGLVDRLGGLHTAVQRAAELAKLPADARTVVVRAPRHPLEPPEPPAPLQPFVQLLGLDHDLLNLALASRRETLFAYAKPVVW